MTKEQHINYWISLADYDIDAAKSMFHSGHYLYVAFLCHQSTEKLLKAYWCQTKDLIPLKIHTLTKLAILTGIWEIMDEEQKQMLSLLEPLNIQSRYPDYKDDLSKMLNKERATNLLKRTLELQLWIREKLLKV